MMTTIYQRRNVNRKVLLQRTTDHILFQNKSVITQIHYIHKDSLYLNRKKLYEY